MDPFDPLRDTPRGEVKRSRRQFMDPARAVRRSGTPQVTLPHSEERLRRLLETANVIPWEADAVTWQMTYVGPQTARILGYPVEDWYQPQFWETHIHPEDRDWVLTFCQDSAAQKLDYDLEYRMVAVGGHIVWLHDVVTVVLDVQGRPMVLQGFMFDITDRKRAEEFLRQSEARFRTVFEQAGIGIALAETEGRLVYSNKAFQKFLGYNQGELRGMNFTEFTHPADAHVDLELYRELMQGRRDRYQMEKRYVRKDGHVVWGCLTVSLFPTLKDLPRYAIGMVEDITERRQAEEALREREQVLCQALTEREQLNEDLHDSILQSLFAIGLSLQTGKQVVREDPAQTVRLIDHACSQLKIVMGEVRSYIAGLAYDVLQGGDLTEALEALVQSFRDSSSARINLEAARGHIAPLPAKKAVHLLHIAREAISNAVRHAYASNIGVTLSEQDRSLRLEVKDNGRGFQATEGLNAGNGLKNIRSRVQKLHGTLNLHSTPDGGTRVLVEVPTHP